MVRAEERREPHLARIISPPIRRLSAARTTWPSLMTDPKIRVLVAKPGLDGHDRGAKTVASVLRDRGMEVIYTGLHQTPEMIAETAMQEDVDVVGLSILSGAHMELFPRVRTELASRGMGHVLLVGGGIIPGEDMERLEAQGFAKLFGPGTRTDAIGEYIESEMRKRRAPTA
jgi:methylmalonyl-CoA mutase C-terminal domain/subunit